MPTCLIQIQPRAGGIKITNGTVTLNLDISDTGEIELRDGTKHVRLNLADLPAGVTNVELYQVSIPTDIAVVDGRLVLTTETRYMLCSGATTGSNTAGEGSVTLRSVTIPTDVVVQGGGRLVLSTETRDMLCAAATDGDDTEGLSAVKKDISTLGECS
jgi:hypothetical protein